MFFHKMREKMKIVVIFVVVAMAGGLLWAGGASLFGSRKGEQVAMATVATVNGEGISQYDLHYAFLNRLWQIEQEQGILSGTYHEMIKFQVLQSLIETALIRQEIEDRGFRVSPQEIEEELQTIVGLFPTVEDYKKQLELVGITEEVLKAQLAEDLKFKQLKKEIIGDLPVEEWEIKEAYEEVRASHILITPEEDTEEGWGAAETSSWEIHGQVSVDNFAELARIHSQDFSGERGGDLGYIHRGETVPDFEAAAFSLAVNEISEPVRSPYGYHIILVTERLDAEGEEFELARPLIEDELRESKGQSDLIAWFEQVREQAQVIYTDHQMNAYDQALLGNLDDAVHYYGLAIEEQPSNGYLHAALGEVYREKDDLEKAIEQYLLAVEKFDGDYHLHLALGDLYGETEDFDQAVQAYLAASSLVPNDIYAQLTLYSKVNSLERYDDAQIIEDRIAAYQEQQAEMLQAQQEAGQESDPEPEDVKAPEGEPEEQAAAED